MHLAHTLSGRLGTLILAVWMALLPVLSALASTHGALDALTATQPGAAAPHGHCQDAADTPAHEDGFAHELAHAWDCCAHSPAALPMSLAPWPALRPEPSSRLLLATLLVTRLESPFRPPIR